MDNKIIEINGVKLEIDMRTVKTIETYKVGDAVKVLYKEYSNSYKVAPGIIIGVDSFTNRPSFTVAYLEDKYSSQELKLVNVNKDTTDIEIAPATVEDFQISKSTLLRQLDNEISRAQASLEDAKYKKEYVLTRFEKYLAKATETTDTTSGAGASS